MNLRGSDHFPREADGEVDIKEFSDAVQKEPNPQHWLHLAYAQHQGRKSADAERSWLKMLTFKLDADQLSDADRMYYTVLANAYKR